MAKRKHVISTDYRLNHKLREQLSTVRGGIVGAAEEQPLPPRFTTIPFEDKPMVTFLDNYTGLKFDVGLHGYKAVRQALSALFPAGPVEVGSTFLKYYQRYYRTDKGVIKKFDGFVKVAIYAENRTSWLYSTLHDFGIKKYPDVFWAKYSEGGMSKEAVAGFIKRGWIKDIQF